MEQNIPIILRSLVDMGVHNKYALAAILAINKKENGFKTRRELSYANTPVSRIKQIFKRARTVPDKTIERLRKDDVAFFSFIYGGRLGNDNAGDGYKYRGGGFNQLTFKKNYITYGRLIKVDLVNNPERIEEVDVAAKVNAHFFKRGFSTNIKSRYGISDINEFKDLDTAVAVIYNINAGTAKDTRIGDPTGGKAKAYAYSKDLLKIVEEFLK